MIPLELIDLICSHISPEILERISVGNILENLNKNRIEKYWKKLGIYELVKLGKIQGVKFLINSVSDSAEIVKISKIGIVEFSIGLVEKFKMSKISDSWRENININPRDYKLIMLASKYGHLNILNYLFQYTFSKKVKKRNKIDKNMLYSVALEKACKYGHLNVVKYLIKLGADVEELFGSNNILHACENGNLELVKCLVENGIDIHGYDDYSTVAAANNGHFHIVKYMISQGVYIDNIKNDCLSIAFRKDYTEMYDYMLSFGADITFNDNYALKDAIKLNRFDKVKIIFEMITEKKLDIKNDSSLKICMREACIVGNINVIQFLVSKGISTKNCKRDARKNNQLHVVKYLENLNKKT
jgi:ankyrin repeat protein